MNFSRQKTDEKIAQASLCLVPVIILAFIAWLRPYWGPMDDANLLHQTLPAVLNDGLLAASRSYALNDLSWGMFRPLYPALVLLIYGPGEWLAPWVSYFWNALLVFGILGAYGLLLSRVLKLRASLILLACSLLIYSWDLFQFLSLQEKQVLFFGGLLTALAWKRDRFSAPAFWACFSLITIAGACSKGSFAIHYSVATVAFAGSQWRLWKAGKRWAEPALVVVLGITQVLVLAKIASGGSYTRRYDYHNVLRNLLTPYGAMVAAPLLLALLTLALRWREVRDKPQELIPAVGLAAFLALFLPWSVQGYVQSVIAPFFAAVLVQLAEFWFRKIPRVVWVLPLCIFALAFTAYRGATMFARLADIGHFVGKAPELRRGGVDKILMPCLEGSTSMRQFFADGPGPSPSVDFLDGAVPKGEHFLFFDRTLCPLPDHEAEPAGCNAEVLWEGSGFHSYRLIKASCR